MTHLLPCDLCDVLPGLGLTDTSITFQLDEIVQVCIYELCLLRKVAVEIALEIKSLDLASSCKFIQ